MNPIPLTSLRDVRLSSKAANKSHKNQVQSMAQSGSECVMRMHSERQFACHMHSSVVAAPAAHIPGAVVSQHIPLKSALQAQTYTSQRPK